MLSTTPIRIEPTNAPDRLPRPPSTTMTKAVSTKNVPKVGNTGYCGAIMPAASPRQAQPRPKAKM
ncbi:hypothetical protein D3C76_1829740 [compost metagenome]